jgi:DNA polymerase III epsilon subunit-like protein
VFICIEAMDNGHRRCTNFHTYIFRDKASKSLKSGTVLSEMDGPEEDDEDESANVKDGRGEGSQDIDKGDCRLSNTPTHASSSGAKRSADSTLSASRASCKRLFPAGGHLRRRRRKDVEGSQDKDKLSNTPAFLPGVKWSADPTLVAFDFEPDWWGKPNNSKHWKEECDGRIIQVGWVAFAGDQEVKRVCEIVRPTAEVIANRPSVNATKFHGITSEQVRCGKPMWATLAELCRTIISVASRGGTVVVHGGDHETRYLLHELSARVAEDRPENWQELHQEIQKVLNNPAVFKDTLDVNMQKKCGILPTYWSYRGLSLGKLYKRLFGSDFENAHSADADAVACARCYMNLHMPRS